MSNYIEKEKKRAIKLNLPDWYYKGESRKLKPLSEFKNLPNYFVDYVENRNQYARSFFNENTYAFVFFSDSHLRQNQMSSSPIIKSIIKNLGVKDIIFGGDFTSAYVTPEMAEEEAKYFFKAYNFDNLYMVRGNHDISGKHFELSETGFIFPNERVEKLIFDKSPKDMVREKGKTYYYFDRPEHNIRFVVIDSNEISYEGKDGNGTWCGHVMTSQEQVDWLIDTLNKTPKGYNVIVLSHRVGNPNMHYNVDTTRWFYDIIKAFNGKGKVDTECKTCTDPIKNFENLKVKGDFSKSNGKVILNLSGDIHRDELTVDEDGCAYYAIHCDSFNDNGGSPFYHVEKSVYECTVSLIIIDKKKGTINSVRYGAGESCKIK